MPAPEPRLKALAGVRGAVSFLTTVPVGDQSRVSAGDIARGAIYFPVVGALTGGAVALSAWLAAHVVPATVAALLAVALGAVATGALHLDGLADTADGYGARTREGALAIMREHAIGTYGMVALVIDLGLRAAAISALLARPWSLLALVAAGALSRSASVALGSLLPHAEAGRGLAALLDGAGWVRPAAAIVVGLVIAVVAAGWIGLYGAAAVATLALLWGWHCTRRLGGVSGDTLGAASEGAELVVLVIGVVGR